MKKKLTMLAVACVAVCAALVLAGCAGESPSQALDKKLKKIQGKDMAQVQALLVASDVLDNGIDLNDLFATDEQAGTTKLTNAQRQSLAPAVEKLLDFDYKITGENVQEKVAYVTVQFTTYDNAGALAKAAGSVLATSVSMGLTGATDEQIMDANCKAVGDAFAALTSKDKTFTTAIPMYKSEEGKWEIADLSADNLNALFGGIGSAMSNAVDSAADVVAEVVEADDEGAGSTSIVKKNGKSVEK